MPEKPNDVDQYLEIGCGRCKFGETPDCKVKSWTDELTLLRSILLQSDLTEEIKLLVLIVTGVASRASRSGGLAARESSRPLDVESVLS